MDKAREAALRILHEVHEHGAYANVALEKELRREPLTGLNRRFMTELVYGTVKAKGTLDWIIGHYVSRPLKAASPIIREILRLGMYQLFYLTKVPPAAACHEAVNLAKKYASPRAAKFVNAVLRAFLREPSRAAFPSVEENPAAALALTYNHPEWLVERWLEELGQTATEKLLRWDNKPPLLSMRVNTLKTTRAALQTALAAENAVAKQSAWSPDGLICTEHGALAESITLNQGLWLAQDESSMQVAPVLSPQPGEFIIDACSAPGGKATHIAALMANRGRILALDVHEHKLNRIQENAARLGIDIIETKLLDARALGEHYRAGADRVLVDAPCSGLGVLRRRGDARWRKTAKDVKTLPLLQFDILAGAAKAVRPGGVLVYSTCTLTTEENETLIKNFLATHNDFTLEKTGAFLPTKPRDCEMVRLWPQIDDTDGFFIARLKRLGKD